MQVERSEVRLYDLNSLQSIKALDGVVGTFPVLADIDGDGINDYICELDRAKDGSKYWFYSGGAWAPLKKLSTGASADRIKLLGRDYDGDGAADFLVEPSAGSAIIDLRSTLTGQSLVKLDLGRANIPCGFRSAVSGGIRMDGQSAIIINVVDASGKSTQLKAFSPSTGKELLASDVLSYENGDGRSVNLGVVSAPDLDGDGVTDILATRTPAWKETLIAYSGRTLRRMWEAPEVVDDGHPTIAFLRDSTGKLVMLAAGCVQAESIPGALGKDGKVFLLKPDSGSTIRVLQESDYPMIARRSPK